MPRNSKSPFVKTKVTKLFYKSLQANLDTSVWKCTRMYLLKMNCKTMLYSFIYILHISEHVHVLKLYDLMSYIQNTCYSGFAWLVWVSLPPSPIHVVMRPVEHLNSELDFQESIRSPVYCLARSSLQDLCVFCADTVWVNSGKATELYKIFP